MCVGGLGAHNVVEPRRQMSSIQVEKVGGAAIIYRVSNRVPRALRDFLVMKKGF